MLPLTTIAQLRLFKFKEKRYCKNVYEYYKKVPLHPDSANTTFLYFDIYDWLGTKYEYGGCDKKGIDCSGFVQAVYARVYCVNTPRSSAVLFKSVKPIIKEELQEGDLIFFKIDNNNINHVGIYLRNNKFVHASSSKGVVISDLSSQYYKKYFYKGGRYEASPQ